LIGVNFNETVATLHCNHCTVSLHWDEYVWHDFCMCVPWLTPEGVTTRSFISCCLFSSTSFNDNKIYDIAPSVGMYVCVWVCVRDYSFLGVTWRTLLCDTHLYVACLIPVCHKMQFICVCDLEDFILDGWRICFGFISHFWNKNTSVNFCTTIFLDDETLEISGKQ